MTETEKRARWVEESINDGEKDCGVRLREALLREREEALERAAQLVEQRCYNHGPRPVSWCQYCQMAIRIRALTPSPEAPPTKVNACQVDLRTDKDRECFEDIVQAATRILRSEPVAPAPDLMELFEQSLALLESAQEVVGWKLQERIAELLQRASTASPAAQGKETRK